MRTATLVAALVTTALSGVAWAQTYDLREQYHEGQIIACHMARAMELKMQSPTPGKPEGEGDIGALRDTELSQVKFRVTRVEGNLPVLQSAFVIAASEASEAPGDAVSVKVSPWQGKAVTVAWKPGSPAAVTAADGAKVDPEAIQWLFSHLPTFLFTGVDLAATPVGHEWDVPQTVAQSALMLDKTAKVVTAIHARFAEVADRDGGKMARVEVKVGAEGSGNKVTLAGVCWFDLGKHLMRSVDLAGMMNVDIDEGLGDGPRVHITGSGPVRMSMALVAKDE